MAAMVSLSPPIEMALRMASSKSVEEKKATSACGTEPWHEADGRDNSDDDAEDQICLLEGNLVVEEPEPRVRPPMRSTPRGLLRGTGCALPHFSSRNGGKTE